MSLFRTRNVAATPLNTNTAPPSLAERANSAAATAAAALSTFNVVIDDLETSATMAEQVAHEAQEEAAGLTALADANLDEAVRRRHQARAIRNLTATDQ